MVVCSAEKSVDRLMVVSALVVDLFGVSVDISVVVLAS